jgi:hypothetical protein
MRWLYAVMAGNVFDGCVEAVGAGKTIVVYGGRDKIKFEFFC